MDLGSALTDDRKVTVNSVVGHRYVLTDDKRVAVKTVVDPRYVLTDE